MKATSKLISVVLILALCLSFSCSAFAATVYDGEGEWIGSSDNEGYVFSDNADAPAAFNGPVSGGGVAQIGETGYGSLQQALAAADAGDTIVLNQSVSLSSALVINKAVKLNEAAALISDNKEYKKALDEMNEVFRQSLPYFEEAHRMNPEDRAYMQILKGLYYRFHMDAKYDEITEKLNSL